MRVFLAVAEMGSMSAAARELQLGQPTVSRRLAELEDQLGYELFRRSVAGAALTSAGEQLVEPARRMAEWAGELERSAQKDHAPSGVVRLTTPPGVAFDFVVPFARRLRRQHPELRLEVRSSIHYVDLARREADLALRTRAPEQRDLVSVAHVVHESAPFASRAYADNLPSGYGVADIDWIGWAPPYEHLSPNPELEALIPGWRPAFATDDFLVMWRAAELGLGAMFLGRVSHPDSRIHHLVELDPGLGQLPQSELHLVCAKSALDIARVRLVADALVSELEQTEELPARAVAPS